MARPNGGTRLEKNDRGVYEIRWSEDGRSKRVSTGQTDFSEALNARAQWDRDLASARALAKGLNVKAILDSYFAEHVAKKVTLVGQETARFYRIGLDAFFGAMDPLDIHPQHVREFTRQRLAGELGRQVCSSTIRRQLGVLIAAMNHAVAEKRLKPTDLPPIPLPEAAPPRDRWLTGDEVTKLFETAAARRPDPERLSRVERFVALAYYTAGRKEALQSLEWRQVDWDLGMIHLARTGERVTKKRRASVPMHPTLRTILERARREATGHLVLDHSGNVRKSFASLVEAAGMVDVTPHVLRHTAATHMLRRGVAIWKVAGILGDTVTTVQKTYGHHVPEALMEAVEALL